MQNRLSVLSVFNALCIKRCAFRNFIKKAKPGKTTRPWGIPAPLLYQEEG